MQRLNRSTYLAILLVLELLLVSCSSPASIESSAQPSISSQPVSSSPNQPEAELGQTLPVSAQVTIANQIIQLEVAKTPQQQAIGLMFRKQLADDRGMLFPFDSARQVSFWMKNVMIPLDMVFLRNGRVAAIALNVPPCVTDPCPTYGPDEDIDQVIELRGGRAKELGLKLGDRLTIKPL